MEKVLSIIIPTYNMEDYLRRCLDSLIIKDEKTFVKLEVLVINDGSRDSSSLIAHEYEERFPEVFRVIDKDNGNYGSCINCGIDEAKGEYFKILDADDWYDTEALKKLIVTISKHKDVDAFFTCFTYHNFNQNIITSYKYKTINYDVKYSINDVAFVNSADEFMLKMYSLTVKLRILRDINLRLDTGISFTDTELLYFPYDSIKNVYFLDADVYQYFIGREGQTISPENGLKSISHVYLIANRFFDDFVLNKSKFLSKNIFNVKLFFVTEYCLAYFNQIIGAENHALYKNELLGLYKKVKNDKDVLRRIRRKSPFFVLWEYTGLYKGDKWAKPLRSILNVYKKK